jgi:rubredoxin---NAD+ reductase
MANKADLVIIGTGLAGYNVAKAWRQLNPSASLWMISEGEAGFYSKPLLSTSLASGKQPEDLWVYDASAMAEQLQATIWREQHVSAIDVDAKYITCASGDRVHYGDLVLAVGAEVIQPALQGDAVSEVLSVNQLEDYSQFRRQLEGRKRVAILGAGLVACEFANDMAKSGFDVAVAAPSEWPLDRLVPQEVGDSLVSALTDQGVAWHLGRWPKGVMRDGEGYRVQLDDGVSIQADIVLSAIGITPRLRLAKQAQLDVGRGVVVDDYLQTSDPHVFALGDCAEIMGHVHPYVAPILHSAKALARTLSGEKTKVSFPMMPIVVKTSVLPIAIVGIQGQVPCSWQAPDTTPEGMQAIGLDDTGQVVVVVLTGSKTRSRKMVMDTYFSA